MSVSKLLGRMVVDVSGLSGFKENKSAELVEELQSCAGSLAHPLIQLSCIFASLIHGAQ